MTNYVVDTMTAAAAIAPSSAAAAGSSFPVTAGYSGDSKTADQTTVIRLSKTTSSANINHTFKLQFDSATATGRIAGTYTYTIYVKSYAPGTTANPSVLTSTVSKDVSIVIAAAATDSKVDSLLMMPVLVSS